MARSRTWHSRHELPVRHTSFPIVGLLLLTTACFNPESTDITDDSDGSTGMTSGAPTTDPSSSTDPSATDPSATDPSTPTATDPTAPTATDPTTPTTATDSSSTGDPTDTTTDATDTADESSTTEDPCEPGFLECGSGMCDVDGDNDPMNCGACGHDCLGGECSDGACEPVSLIFNSEISAIAADEDNVYYSTSSGSSSGSAAWIPQSAGASSTSLVAEFGSSSRFVRVDNTHVYVEGGSNGTTGYIARVAKTGGSWINLFEPEDVSFPSGPDDLTLSPARAIWSTAVVLGGSGEYIRGIAKDGQGSSTSYLANSPDFVATMGANSNFLFFYQGQTAQELRRRPHGLGGVAPVLSAVSSAHAIAVDNDGVYFSGVDASSGLATLWSMDPDGSSPTILLTSADAEFDDGRGLLMTEDELLWADLEEGGNVYRTMGTDGTNPRTIENGVVGTNQFNQFAEGSLTADSEAYFYLADSQIWMLAK